MISAAGDRSEEPDFISPLCHSGGRYSTLPLMDGNPKYFPDKGKYTRYLEREYGSKSKQKRANIMIVREK